MPDRPGFAIGVSDATGLDPRVIYSWTYAENDDAHEARRPYNWLNWKWDVDLAGPFANEDPATDGGAFPGYFRLADAVRDAAHRINSSDHYAGIRASVGRSTSAQIAAITASAWGTSRPFPLRDLPKSTVTAQYWRWVAWRLGEGEFKDAGPRNASRRPRSLPRVVPLSWWPRYAAYLAKRRSH